MKAFTLIEMLLAVAICAIVLVAINGVFATAVRLRDKTSEAVEEALPANRAMDMMVRDLKGTVGPGGLLAGDFKCGAQAMGASMGWVSGKRRSQRFTPAVYCASLRCTRVANAGVAAGISASAKP